jgi:hypothetical protein
MVLFIWRRRRRRILSKRKRGQEKGQVREERI